jgi:DNA-binding response OmpR family regulator
MTTEPDRRLDLLCRQLTESIMGAALCAQEIASIVREATCGDGRSCVGDNGHPRRDKSVLGRPVLDEATLSVVWNGRLLHLGHTQGFWLLARLTRSANQYVTHLDLLQEIWDDEFTDTAVLRAGVRRLRTKLRRGGMGDLADAIVGHHGRYMLTLTSPPRHTEVTASSH